VVEPLETFKLAEFTKPDAVMLVEEALANDEAPVTWKEPTTCKVLEASAREPTVKLVPIAPVVVALNLWTSVAS
jgi:hypothetical protein